MAIIPKLTEEECYLLAIFQDISGIDQAEFCVHEHSNKETGLFRAWPVQIWWWRDKSQKQIMAASRSIGKALDVNTPVPTANRSWVTMGDLQVGDVLYDETGSLTNIVKAHDTLYGRECLEIFFTPIIHDALDVQPTSVVADVDHEWVVQDHYGTSTTKTSSQLTVGDQIEGRGVTWVIANIQSVDSRPVRCIEVDSPSHLFCVNQFIPTHNSLSIKLRALAFPFVMPGQEMVITAPEHIHLQAVTDNVEALYENTWIAEQMLAGGRRGRITKRPWQITLKNRGRIMGRIPKPDGSGIKGCVELNTPVLTKDGYKKAIDVQEGDEVWTHKNRWMPVLSNQVFKTGDCYEVKGQGGFPTIVTDHHRLPIKVNETPEKKKRLSKDIEWCSVSDLPRGGRARNKKNEKPIQAHWTIPVLPSDESLGYPELQTTSGSPTRGLLERDTFWMIGRMLADGFTSWSGEVGSCNIVASAKDQPHILSVLDGWGVPYYITQRRHSTGDVIKFVDTDLAKFFDTHFGKYPHEKKIPTWAMFMGREYKQALLDGYMAGDGSCFSDRDVVAISSTSPYFTLGMIHLAVSLGYPISSCHIIDANVTEINGVSLKDEPLPSHRAKIAMDDSRSHMVFEDGYAYGRVNEVNSVSGTHTVCNIVTDDHSYFANGILHSNTHPIWLELDEGQDYGEPGWDEVVSTLQYNTPGSRWRVAGVTRGVGDTFDDKISGNDSTWKIIKLPAMLRPDWTDQERADKIEEFKGYNSVNYRRNVLGLPGDASAYLLNLSQIFQNVDQDTLSYFNSQEYWRVDITEGMLLGGRVDPVSFIEPPGSHAEYDKIWIGMDFGLTTSLSCIAIFAETKVKKSLPDPNNGGKLKSQEQAVLKLIGLVTMSRITTDQQWDVLQELFMAYKPTIFAIDYHGVGKPLYDVAIRNAKDNPDISWMVERIKGYSFSEKIIVGIDDQIEYNANKSGDWEKAAIKKNGKEAAIDALRTMIDRKQFYFPYDKAVIGDLQATPKKGLTRYDEYGKPKRKDGEHMLDAIMMVALAHTQRPIEEMIAQYQEVRPRIRPRIGGVY